MENSAIQKISENELENVIGGQAGDNIRVINPEEFANVIGGQAGGNIQVLNAEEFGNGMGRMLNAVERLVQSPMFLGALFAGSIISIASVVYTTYRLIRGCVVGIKKLANKNKAKPTV